MTETLIKKGSIELVPIYPTNAGVPLVPDLVALLPVGTALTNATGFTAPGTLNSLPAILVNAPPVGIYGVVCKMNTQGDGQAPVWRLDGTIRVIDQV